VDGKWVTRGWVPEVRAKKKYGEHVLELKKKKINSVEIDIGRTLKKHA